MPRLTLALYALYLGLTLGWRSWLQLRRTGSTGFVGISRTGGLEQLGGSLLVASVVLGLLSPLAELSGALALLTAARPLAGIALYAAGLALTLAAQLQMGASWRIGVNPAEKTGLVTGGPFAFARNPIFAGMIAAALGLALLVPNLLALLAVGVLIVGLEVQVRLVEEPYLVKQHGDSYLSWARRTGRFCPLLGRLS